MYMVLVFVFDIIVQNVKNKFDGSVKEWKILESTMKDINIHIFFLLQVSMASLLFTKLFCQPM